MSKGSDCNAGRIVEDRLDDLPFDRAERAVLDIARRIFGTFATPAGQGWISAFEASERHFGPEGAILAHRIVKTIQVLRRNRTAVFGFVNPDCPCCRQRITPEERYFISILHAARRERRSDAMLNAIFVCGGPDPSALVEAVDLLSADLTAFAAVEIPAQTGAQPNAPALAPPHANPKAEPQA
ncbi:MAG: hypothetical protein AAF675_13790 [Pseudomonadota bacterium]